MGDGRGQAPGADAPGDGGVHALGAVCQLALHQVVQVEGLPVGGADRDQAALLTQLADVEPRVVDGHACRRDGELAGPAEFGHVERGDPFLRMEVYDLTAVGVCESLGIECGDRLCSTAPHAQPFGEFRGAHSDAGEDAESSQDDAVARGGFSAVRKGCHQVSNRVSARTKRKGVRPLPSGPPPRPRRRPAD